jgi:hypothetical protein
MKYTWEPEDIVPGRRLLCTSSTEQYMIGYIVNKGARRSNTYVIVSGRDGLIIFSSTCKATIAAHMNEYDYVPATVDPEERPPLTSD